MGNKILMGVLILLVILSGSVSYYSYTVSRQVEIVSEQLARLNSEQAERIDTLSGELTVQKTEILSEVGELESGINQNLGKIGGLESKIDGIEENRLQIDGLEGEISRSQDRTRLLEDEIKETAELSKSLSGAVLDANLAFEIVNQATVSISDGTQTIGSGFVYDNEGHAVTAQHVVANLSEIYLVFPDGQVRAASITGTDAFSDVAVLEFDNEIEVTPPVIADSSGLKVGEPVVVVGSPFSLHESLTSGIVSQTNRFTDIEYNSQTRWVANLIQFDAAVNFGNSGGPLVNAAGEIIGLVIARISPLEGDGVYYAVSANKFRRVADAIIAEGSFDYPWFGVAISDLTPQMVSEMNLETIDGTLVASVMEDGPADVAGVQVNDIILSVDGIPIASVADLVSYLGEMKTPGDQATLGIRRDTTEIELSLEIGKRPD
ncbi:MAG: trypsin-like peptidase domain-containing protein [Chloroflexi bacterium]|nr:trypsin-like peptidase domain-containing protein [Chloroflexota bacterium]